MALAFSTDFVESDADDLTVEFFADQPTESCEPHLSLVRANTSLLIWLYR